MHKTITMNKDKNIILIILGILIGLNNIIIGYKIFGISFDRIFEILIFFILIKTFIKDLQDKNLLFISKLILFLFVFLIFKSFILLINDASINFAEIIRPTIRIIMNILFLYLCYYLFKNDKRKINLILLVYFVAFLLAFLQNPSTPFTNWAQNIKLELFSVNMKDYDIIYYKAFLAAKTQFMRVTGPYGQTITLSYALVVAGILSTYMYIETSKIIYLYNTFFIFVVSIMTLTRSAVLAILIMIIFIFKKNKFILIFTVLISIILFLNLDIFNISQFSRVVSNDSSSDSKFLLLITGIMTLILHPFGATEENIMNIREWMYTLYHEPDILRFPPHNGIINFGFEYTTIAYLLLFTLIIYLFKISIILSKEKKTFWLFAFFSYFIQQSFHNNGLFVSEFNVLIILALYLIDILNKQLKD